MDLQVEAPEFRSEMLVLVGMVAVCREPNAARQTLPGVDCFHGRSPRRLLSYIL
jgi:hypothetical protein